MRGKLAQGFDDHEDILAWVDAEIIRYRKSSEDNPWLWVGPVLRTMHTLGYRSRLEYEPFHDHYPAAGTWTAMFTHPEGGLRGAVVHPDPYTALLHAAREVLRRARGMNL